jgi:hypothetical protein
MFSSTYLQCVDHGKRESRADSNSCVSKKVAGNAEGEEARERERREEWSGAISTLFSFSQNKIAIRTWKGRNRKRGNLGAVTLSVPGLGLLWVNCGLSFFYKSSLFYVNEIS